MSKIMVSHQMHLQFLRSHSITNKQSGLVFRDIQMLHDVTNMHLRGKRQAAKIRVASCS